MIVGSLMQRMELKDSQSRYYDIMQIDKMNNRWVYYKSNASVSSDGTP
ncbi:unnamed protein product [Strongylus vulgaris]|uniref:Uncharacterized protein n=1 Tax=Strongylus vulgaris TaxID=40348 RepID=A0A3P7IV60_STRVU|nr:unnamed protein product [Strongylus vulgaris]